MSDFYGPADDAESVATIQAAVDAGVTLLDTGDYYGMGHNELLLRGPDGGWLGFDGRPAAVKTFLTYTLRRLGTDYVDVYRLGRSPSPLWPPRTSGTRAPAPLARAVGRLQTRPSAR